MTTMIPARVAVSHAGSGPHDSYFFEQPSELIAGRVVAPRIEHMHGEHRFATVDDVFGSGHLPDSVCAMALAWLGAIARMEVAWL